MLGGFCADRLVQRVCVNCWLALAVLVSSQTVVVFSCSFYFFLYGDGMSWLF